MKRYTRKQIREAIGYWESVLKRMDESKSILLDTLAEKFGTDTVFSRKPYVLTDDSAVEIARVFNAFLFDSAIIDFPAIKVVTYG